MAAIAAATITVCHLKVIRPIVKHTEANRMARQALKWDIKLTDMIIIRVAIKIIGIFSFFKS